MFSWITFLLICFFAPLSHGGRHNSISTSMQYHMHAKEAIIKTFEIDNMIIDCVDIYKQSTLQHPLLVNHTLQMKSNYPDKTNDFATEASQPWNLYESCPEGYIPIKRIKINGQFADDILKVHSHKYSDVQNQAVVQQGSIIRASKVSFNGGKATLNVWNPKVDSQSQSSSAQLWMTTEETFKDWLEVGWMVNPKRYGNADPRFFLFRTADNYETTGCYDLDCQGFVQTNHGVVLGASLQPVSVYGGQQSTIDIELFKDKTTENWWVRLQGADLGYWPKEIVPTLANGATIIDFGGKVAFTQSGVDPTTEMGSGHFPQEGFGKASFIRNVQVLDSSFTYQTHGDIDILKNNKKCYDLQVDPNATGSWGLFFYFGGSCKS